MPQRDLARTLQALHDQFDHFGFLVLPVFGISPNRRTWVWWCLAAVTLVVGPSAAFAQPRCADGRWNDVHLAGRLGDREIRGHLGEAFATADSNGVFGVFFYPSTWTPDGDSSMFALEGTFADDCSPPFEGDSVTARLLRSIRRR